MKTRVYGSNYLIHYKKKKKTSVQHRGGRAEIKCLRENDAGAGARLLL